MNKTELSERLKFYESKLHNMQLELRSLRIGLSEPEVCSIDEQVLKMFDEKYRIGMALKLTNHKYEAAKILGFNQRTFYRKLKMYDL